VIFAAGPWQAAQAASPFAREVPTTYGKFEKDTGSLTLVVAELVATDYLKGYDCPPMTPRTNPDGTTTVSVCLGPGPTWFKARVLQRVAGPDIGEEFYAVTGSHWGAMKIGPSQPAALMLLNRPKEGVRPIAESAFAGVFVVAALYSGVNEGTQNWQAMWTCAIYLLFAITLWRARAAQIPE